MGNTIPCCETKRFIGVPNEEIETADAGDLKGKVHIIIAGIDYTCDRSWRGKVPPLDTRVAFEMFVDLAKKCDCATIKTLWNQECTKKDFLEAIEEVGEDVEEGDFFVVYYTGHGDLLADDNGDEEDGFDSAMCLLGPDGNVEPRSEVWLRDDDFAEAIMEHVTSGAKIITVMDCCHAGTIMDFDSPRWVDEGFNAISITGCADKETSAGTSKGGQFSRALSRATQDLQKSNGVGYMASDLYNRTVQCYQEHKMSSHTQHITIHGVGVYPHEMVWPLQPKATYISPANTKALRTAATVASFEARTAALHPAQEPVAHYHAR